MADCLTVELKYSATRRNAQNISAELEGDISCLNGVTNVSVESVSPEQASTPATATVTLTLSPHINTIGEGLIKQTIDSLPYIKTTEA